MAFAECAVLRRHLKNAESLTRAPKKLKRSFKDATQNPTKACRIFLEAGFQPWLGFFLAKNAIEGTAHFQGKADDAKLISTLDTRSSQEIEDIAADVGKEELIDTFRGRVKEWGNYCGYYEWLKGTAATVTGDSDDRVMVDSPDSQSVSIEYEPHLSVSSAPDQGTATHQDSFKPAEVGLVHHMEIATMTGVMDVFPPYICGAVVKGVCYDAIIAMEFPPLPSDDCLMTLTIQPNKIEYLAMALFETHLESDDQQRYLVLQNGSRVVPSKKMSLEGASEGAINAILGQSVHDAIKASFKHLFEGGDGICRTRCVTMQVDMKPNEPALLQLCLNLERGVALKKKLYLEKI